MERTLSTTTCPRRLKSSASIFVEELVVDLVLFCWRGAYEYETHGHLVLTNSV